MIHSNIPNSKSYFEEREERRESPCFEDAQKFLEDYSQLFNETQDQVKSALANTEYFHGTGAKHYATNSSKYQTIDYSTINDSFQSFLKDGILPQEDLFNKINNGKSTISMSKLCMYARVYADMYQEEGNDLQYEFGSRTFWLRKINIQTVKNLIKNPTDAIIFIKQATLSILGSIKNRKLAGENFVALARSDEKYANKRILTMKYAQSDIKGNYPIIFGIKPDSIEDEPGLLKTKAVKMYETRTSKPITPDLFSHIQVPLKNLAEAQTKVHNSGLDIPVIPIEFAEVIASQKHITDHLKIK